MVSAFGDGHDRDSAYQLSNPLLVRLFVGNYWYDCQNKAIVWGVSMAVLSQWAVSKIGGNESNSAKSFFGLAFMALTTLYINPILLKSHTRNAATSDGISKSA
eukprot:GHVU01067962.1.p4 GENE.GHVU01067962.1~~GHVU01067962.1.p4  ORF type:complete len:103 (-),score=10.55 GHVU01067962.1:3018-3326(-)